MDELMKRLDEQLPHELTFSKELIYLKNEEQGLVKAQRYEIYVKIGIMRLRN